MSFQTSNASLLLFPITEMIRLFSNSYKVSADTIHLVFAPVRWYYRLMRALFGDTYQPFDEIKQGVHPIASLYKKYQGPLRLLVKSPRYIFTSVLALIMYYILRAVPHQFLFRSISKK